MDNEAYLIAATYTKDEIGQQVPTKTKRRVFVTENSGTRQDQIAAGREGLRIAYRLDTSLWDYQDERFVEYKGAEYDIGRTFIRYGDEIIELYLVEKADIYG